MVDAIILCEDSPLKKMNDRKVKWINLTMHWYCYFNKTIYNAKLNSIHEKTKLQFILKCMAPSLLIKEPLAILTSSFLALDIGSLILDMMEGFKKLWVLPVSTKSITQMPFDLTQKPYGFLLMHTMKSLVVPWRFLVFLQIWHSFSLIFFELHLFLYIMEFSLRHLV